MYDYINTTLKRGKGNFYCRLIWLPFWFLGLNWNIFMKCKKILFLHSNVQFLQSSIVSSNFPADFSNFLTLPLRIFIFFIATIRAKEAGFYMCFCLTICRLRSHKLHYLSLQVLEKNLYPGHILSYLAINSTPTLENIKKQKYF